MLTQLHIMPDNIYSRTELNGIYFTFKFHHAFANLTLGNANEKNSLSSSSFNSINIIRVEEFHEKSIYDKVKRGHLWFIKSTSF